MSIQYWLGWFDKEEGNLIGEQLLEGVNEREIIDAFNLQPDEETVDSFPVIEGDRAWLESKGVHIQMDKYSYFIAGIAPLDSRGPDDFDTDP
jgi:hypothetical protein